MNTTFNSTDVSKKSSELWPTTTYQTNIEDLPAFRGESHPAIGQCANGVDQSGARSVHTAPHIEWMPKRGTKVMDTATDGATAVCRILFVVGGNVAEKLCKRNYCNMVIMIIWIRKVSRNSCKICGKITGCGEAE